MPRAIFTLSLDFELIWGTVHHLGPQRFREACHRERAIVIDRLLALFEKYRVPATWCIVGHLFLGRCQAQFGQKHPELTLPSANWLRDDPGGSEATEPNFYGRSLVEKIRSCAVSQEIGCHSFSHIIFPECSRETARSEIAECVRLAAESGIEMRSFAFPRNRVAHLGVLKEYGFTHYRGPGKNERFDQYRLRAMRRVVHLLDILLAREPRPVVPEMNDGLWNVAGSMVFLPKHGLRRYIPMSLRVRRARKGLNAAVRDGGIFHLWFHPTNMADEMESMFKGLEEILACAYRLSQAGKMDFLPLSSVTGRNTSESVLQDLAYEGSSHHYALGSGRN